ncbi:N-acetylmuramoyl-L-alanine amidase [Corynebacterium freiburgense]|uniref:N-acetylmuramoyl-L-alanine amidase n=1 Tax=Corynebacterium freiburgense TaxID=556548 RepID=UPI0004053809|nr:N-acetylmuramoyl-L-alanine amidase [Corynebacterium freiburgense]WJZ03871.1 N-acetylmuramoyl-L-alanine amidase [Corynebacterium freiburgense]
MLQRRRLLAVSHRPALAAILAVTLLVSVVLSVGGIQKTQDAGQSPISADINTTSFDGGDNVVVEDSAIIAQGETAGPRSVKEFSREEPFSIFALSWQGDRNLAAFFRAQKDDGSWGPWYDAEPLNENIGANTGTEPIYLEATKKVQVAVHNVGDPAGIEAVFIDGKADEGGIALTAESDGMPNVVTRAGWRADESIRCGSPTYDSETNAITIHHTAGSNNYTQAEAAGIVRGIYQYHAQQLGWCDIGYHSLVDKYGTIYEGRFGGLSKPVQGAHAGGFNENTWAISMLGNYEEVEPTGAMINAVGEMAGWRAKVGDFDPTGQDLHYSEGTSFSKYPYGQSVTLPNIFAHRDVGNTACPGSFAYAKMDTIRDIAKRKYDSIGNVSGDALTTEATTHANAPKDTKDTTATQTTTTAATTSKTAAAEPAAEAASAAPSAAPLANVLKSQNTANALGTLLAAGVGLLAAEGRLPSDVTKMGNIDIIQGLQLKDIPATVQTLINLAGDDKFAATWRKVTDAVGPILGQPRGGVHTATPVGERNSAVEYVPFENGMIVSSPEAGTHAVWGKIGDAWAAQGFDSGHLGLPISEEYLAGDLIRVDFQGGYITFNPVDGNVEIHAA